MTARWPASVAGLPVCTARGLPVPFSSGVAHDGAGRFGSNDPLAKLLCATKALCGICGRPLGGGEIVFLVAARPLRHPVFPDPPSHEQCAVDAMTLCPHIRQPREPGGWMMWVTSSYEPVMPGRTSLVDFAPGPLIRIRRFTYDGRGHLAERKMTT